MGYNPSIMQHEGSDEVTIGAGGNWTPLNIPTDRPYSFEITPVVSTDTVQFSYQKVVNNKGGVAGSFATAPLSSKFVQNIKISPDNQPMIRGTAGHTFIVDYYRVLRDEEIDYLRG